MFAWTIVILLLIGFAICCWVFSFYVFGHPEKPFSYSILAKLKKLEAPKRFEITAAPQGEFLNAQQLWDRYNKMTNRELERASETLLRNYLRNYKLTSDKVPYVVGSFNILDSYELGRSQSLFFRSCGRLPTQRTRRKCFSNTFLPQTSGSFPSFIACC